MSKENPGGEPMENIESPDTETCQLWEESTYEDTDVDSRGKVCTTCEMYQGALCCLWGEE